MLKILEKARQKSPDCVIAETTLRIKLFGGIRDDHLVRRQEGASRCKRGFDAGAREHVLYHDCAGTLWAPAG